MDHASNTALADRLEPTLRAFAWRPDTLPPGGPGPLAGMAVGVKDIVDTADMPTSYGSPLFAGHRPERDAEIVRRLRQAGAVVFGKTATTEFAWRHPAATRNPWNAAHTPGGSSSGSAAAVAAGIVELAIGTQTVGSVIRPAAFCGVVGFKPSFGVLPTDGVRACAPSLDHVGLFAREVATVARAMGALAGVAADAVERPRLLVLRDVPGPAASAAQAEVLERAATLLCGAGAAVSETSFPAKHASVWADLALVLGFEAALEFGALVDRAPAGTSEALRRLVADGRGVAVLEYERARAAQRVFREAVGRLLDGFDALLTVPAPGVAPLGLADTGDARFCAPWSFAGVPAMTLRAGWSEGLPLGVQLVGAFGGDGRVLGVGRWAEKAGLCPEPRQAPGAWTPRA